MPCHINNCQITDASHLMQCSGSCGRSYHAACAGTQRNYENEITNYMIPLCRDCQGVISVEVTTRAVLLQQQKLTCDIKALIDANFKACNAFKQMDNKIEVVQDEYEGIATLLGEMQQQLNRLDKKIDDSTLNNNVTTGFTACATISLHNTYNNNTNNIINNNNPSSNNTNSISSSNNNNPSNVNTF
ncbi:AN1-type zinc finger and UBX domain-containing protein DDB_G0268260-like [Culex pipiens pallens]|uniref:AN1-type zinc finger and UBX domain-containing protein DDB_G0268260-like n=1 Tax=Culex pipiens pallens TaxID=42434 RepID=UPI0022AA38DC|nr:AN1-type zinc finger and UBX domain-containing protein DDB_G0268260-like [Culex pipiens pallens]